MKQFKSPSRLRYYTSSKNSLVTIVDKKAMKKIDYYLDNPPSGTASLDRLLKQIEREKQT